MGTLNSWDVVDNNNNAAPPDGWPENTMNYSDVNNTGRAVQGTLKRFFADINGSLDAGGAADAYTLTLNESGYTAYFDGLIFSCSIPATNLTTTPTMNVNGIGAATIVDRLGGAVGIGELMAGGIYDFRHDGTNLRLIGSAGVAGLTTEFQFNDGGAFGGASGLTYNSLANEATAVNPFNISADILFAEISNHVSVPAAGNGILWLRDDNPTVLVFTNSAGVDTTLGVNGTANPGGADTQVQFNNSGAFGGSANLTWDGTELFVDSRIAISDAVEAELRFSDTGAAANNQNWELQTSSEEFSLQLFDDAFTVGATGWSMTRTANTVDQFNSFALANRFPNGGLVFGETADHPETPAASFGQVWVRNDSPNTLVFTDDAGTDFDIGGAAVITSSLTQIADNVAFSGASELISGIASDVNRIIILFDDMSADANANISLRLGDSGGIENSGYTGASTGTWGAGTFGSEFWIAFDSPTPPSAASLFVGRIVLEKVTDHIWHYDLVLNANNSGTGQTHGQGRKGLTTALTQFEIILSTGNFDDGEYSIWTQT